MEQAQKSKKFEAPRPLPAAPHPSKRSSTKKMTAFDWPVNIISNAFNPKHVDAFYCRKKTIFHVQHSTLGVSNVPFQHPYYYLLFCRSLSAFLFYFIFFPSFFVMLRVIWMCFCY